LKTKQKQVSIKKIAIFLPVVKTLIICEFGDFYNSSLLQLSIFKFSLFLGVSIIYSLACGSCVLHRTFQNVCDNSLCVFVEILKRFNLKCERHHLNPPLSQEHNINLFCNRVQKYTEVRLILNFYQLTNTKTVVADILERPRKC
jgi:hypothetical protein